MHSLLLQTQVLALPAATTHSNHELGVESGSLQLQSERARAQSVTSCLSSTGAEERRRQQMVRIQFIRGCVNSRVTFRPLSTGSGSRLRRGRWGS